MKSKLLTLLFALTASVAFGHGGVKIGPNGGRILEFSKNETMHGEVTVKDGKFHVALLDKEMKPVAVDAQSLAATGGTRDKPVKLEVTKDAEGFTLPLVREGQWLILQFKVKADGKAVTARMEYDTSNCEKCSSPEWLCKCSAKKAEDKHDHKDHDHKDGDKHEHKDGEKHEHGKKDAKKGK